MPHDPIKSRPGIPGRRKVIVAPQKNGGRSRSKNVAVMNGPFLLSSQYQAESKTVSLQQTGLPDLGQPKRLSQRTGGDFW